MSVSNIALPPYTRRIWYYDKADIIGIMKNIEMFRWQAHLNNITCPDEQVKLLNEVLLNIYSNFIPNEVKTIRPRQAPWITKSVKNFLRNENRAYKNFVRSGRPGDRLEGIQNMISKGSKMIEDAKRNYFIKAGKTLANHGTSNKTYWSLMNTVLNKAKIPIIPPLLENGIFVTDFTEKAQLFNDYFILQCTTIDTGSHIPQDALVTDNMINDFVISDEKILNIIRALNPNKAHGWDEISVRMIKFSDVALVNPLKIIFTNCLRRGRFPKIWKYANVVPVHKKNEKNVKGNYRPISLLPIFGKILEKLVYDSLYSHLVSHDLLNPNQSGFRPGDSTVNQLISITHSIYKAFDCNSPLDVRSVYLDISKAFDRVWHDGLIYKLKRCGVSGKLLSLLQSFLMDRKQRTVLNGQCSSWGDISAGVPQGSILGPLFFLVYINDLTENLKCNVKLFADDTSLFTVVENSNAAANGMNHDLELIMQWVHDWRMSFNPDPQKQAVELIFSTKKTEVDHPVMLFNNVPVKKANEHKHLGIVLDSKLSFSAHIRAAISKNRKGIGLLKCLSKYLPRQTLNELYKLYVRPHLDYGDVLYHNPAKVCEFSNNVILPHLMEKLESVQYSSALAVTGAWRGSSREKLYAELGWESLSCRRWSRRLTLFYNIVNHLTPKYTLDPIPPLHQSQYSLRKPNVIGRIRARTEKFQSSFYLSESINNFFCTIGETLSDKIPSARNPLLENDYEVNPEKNKFQFHVINTLQLEKNFSKSKTSKGCGTDGIASCFLKIALPVISESLCDIFNLSLATGCFPDSWKIARVAPIFKNGQPDDRSNYRPISVLPVLARVFEKIIHNQLYHYLDKNNHLFSNQSGFRALHSVVTCLLNSTDDWYVNMDNGKYTANIFIDLKRHSIL